MRECQPRNLGYMQLAVIKVSNRQIAQKLIDCAGISLEVSDQLLVFGFQRRPASEDQFGINELLLASSTRFCGT